MSANDNNIADATHGTWLRCRTCGSVEQVVRPDEMPMEVIAFSERLLEAKCPVCPAETQKLVFATPQDVEAAHARSR